MAVNSLPARIVIRNDTAANWTSNNPTLLLGELGLETDTGKVKLGNGTSAWTSLGYVTKWGEVFGPASSVSNNFAGFDGTGGKTLKDSGYSPSSFAAANHTHASYLTSLADDTTPELTGPLDCNSELIYWDIYTISGTTIDVANGHHQKLTLTGSIAASLTTPSGATAFHLYVVQSASSAYTIGWSGVYWAGGTAPDLSTLSGKYVICLAYDGTNWFGSWSKYA